jgi:ectoine hydroxylase-related dioxygenase (phytanoyl-CoA dioxygenase family)
MSQLAVPTKSSVVSDEQLEFYHREGYVLVRGLIPSNDLRAAHRILLQLEAGNYADWAEEHFQYFDPRRVINDNGTRIPGGVQLPAKKSEAFRAIADHPRLQHAMRQILAAPVERFTDQCGIKSRYITTEQGGQSFFHQDSYYWRIAPELGCNCWIPFDSVGADAIALAIMPRSQEGWKLEEHEHYFDDPALCGGRSNEPFKRKRIPLDRIDFSKEVLLPMAPGDGLFFTNYTWHRSEKNRSAETKCFYAIAYQRAK